MPDYNIRTLENEAGADLTIAVEAGYAGTAVLSKTPTEYTIVAFVRTELGSISLKAPTAGIVLIDSESGNSLSANALEDVMQRTRIRRDDQTTVKGNPP